MVRALPTEAVAAVALNQVPHRFVGCTGRSDLLPSWVLRDHRPIWTSWSTAPGVSRSELAFDCATRSRRRLK